MTRSVYVNLGLVLVITLVSAPNSIMTPLGQVLNREVMFGVNVPLPGVGSHSDVRLAQMYFMAMMAMSNPSFILGPSVRSF
jgi:hypothetical protein